MQLTYTSDQFGRLARVAAGNADTDVHRQFRTLAGSGHTYTSPAYLFENSAGLLAKMQLIGEGFIIFSPIPILYRYYVQ